MDLEVIPYISALVLGLIIPLTGIFFLGRFRNIYGYKFGIALFGGSFIWVLSYYFELLSLAEGTKLFWSKIKYLGVTSIPVALFFLVLYYTGYSKWVNLKKIALFSLIPAATMALVFTNQYHGLIWESITFETSGILSYINESYGPWFWLWITYCYSLTITALIMLARLLASRQKVFRSHAIVLIITISIPILFTVLDVFAFDFLFKLKLAPMGLTLGSSALLYGFMRLKIGDFIPISVEPEIENNQDMVLAVDKNDRVVYANQPVLRYFDKNNLIGEELDNIWPSWNGIKSKLSSGFEIIDNLTLSGLPNIFSLTINPFMDMNKKIIGKILIFNDVTEQRLAEERYRSIFKNSLDGIFRLDMDGNYIEVNGSMLKIFNCSRKQELPLIDIAQEMKKSLQPFKKTVECRLAKKGGEKIWVEASIWSVMDKNSKTYYEGIVRDISSRKKTEQKIKYLSFHDSLTGLYNRYFFEEELKRLDTERMYPISIIIGDVNGLKLINDTFGHNQGDKLLRKIAQILKDGFRKEDILARWGGDEFIAILPHTIKKDALKIIERIKVRCRNESKKQLTLSISLGCACKQTPDCNIGLLIKEAEDKMYRHKLIETKSARSQMISSLGKALEEKDFETEEHMQRMKKLSRVMGKRLGLPESDLDELNLLATLHDIGKIAIADNIIFKPDKLSVGEWDIIKKHPEIGYRIASQSPELTLIAEAILSHHENWDGSGYPRGLKGDQIPILARIIAVVDAYDAMTNDRPYRKALTPKEALYEIKKCAGTQFDPEVAAEFVAIFEKNNIVT
ncbi:MAG: diguanylate cyclase [Actinomycetia bacterium]|nr:diguanylate cyclase [Actinomycetes bacterium]